MSLNSGNVVRISRGDRTTPFPIIEMERAQRINRDTCLAFKKIRPIFVTRNHDRPRRPADNLIKRRKNSSNLYRSKFVEESRKKKILALVSRQYSLSNRKSLSLPFRIMRAKFDRSLTYRPVKAKIKAKLRLENSRFDIDRLDVIDVYWVGKIFFFGRI